MDLSSITENEAIFSKQIFYIYKGKYIYILIFTKNIQPSKTKIYMSKINTFVL